MRLSSSYYEEALRECTSAQICWCALLLGLNIFRLLVVALVSPESRTCPRTQRIIGCVALKFSQ